MGTPNKVPIILGNPNIDCSPKLLILCSLGFVLKMGLRSTCPRLGPWLGPSEPGISKVACAVTRGFVRLGYRWN